MCCEGSKEQRLHALGRVVRPGFKFAVNAIGQQFPALSPIVQVHLQLFQYPYGVLFFQDRESDFNTLLQVPFHPVGA